MNNIIVPFPNKKNFAFYNQNDIDGFIIGIEDFSENFNYYVKNTKLKEIVDLLNEKNKKIYVMLNKVYMNDMIDKLKNILNKISKLNITAVIFSDVSVFNIVKEQNLNINLIWNSKMTTNSKSINFFEKRGLYGYIPTPELTIDEIKYIIKNTNSKPIVKLFGYTNMATSSRSLITNYFKYTNTTLNPKDKYYIHEKESDNYYPIIESDVTNFFSSKILNGILEYKKMIDDNLNFDVYLDDYMIDINPFYNVLEAFSALKNNYKDNEFIYKLNDVINANLKGNTNDGFLNKKTIFKVK